MTIHRLTLSPFSELLDLLSSSFKQLVEQHDALKMTKRWAVHSFLMSSPTAFIAPPVFGSTSSLIQTTVNLLIFRLMTLKRRSALLFLLLLFHLNLILINNQTMEIEIHCLRRLVSVSILTRNRAKINSIQSVLLIN